MHIVIHYVILVLSEPLIEAVLWDLIKGVDAMDMVRRDEVMKARIWNLLDSIENKLGKMAHETDLVDELKKFQDGDLKPLYFYNRLAKYWDSLNMD